MRASPKIPATCNADIVSLRARRRKVNATRRKIGATQLKVRVNRQKVRATCRKVDVKWLKSACQMTEI
jgi:hypothetical protein